MDKRRTEEEIAGLRKLIAYHENLYRIKNAPEISDEEFDSLMRRLRQLEAEYPEFYDADSPSARVGSDLSGAFASVAHLSPMLSLDNVFNSSELDDFDARLKKLLGVDGVLRYCVEPKIDGAGISAVYENGRLARLLTRGDGETGDDITRNAFAVKNLPLSLSGENLPSLMEIRGEAYMEISEFERISAAQKAEFVEKALAKKLREGRKSDPYLEGVSLSEEEMRAVEKRLPANPRNLTAGTLKLLDADVLKSRSLMAVFYSVGTLEGAEIKKQHELPGMLASWGLPSVNWHRLADGPKGAFERICELEEVRADFPFNTDGAVVKLDDCSLHEKAGMTSHAPRWAVAWKYRAERAETRLNSITIQVGRTGAVTPVAELEPIKNLSGTEVRRATLHNEGYIAEKDIRVGDTVVVEKAGEIIPAVLGVVPEKRPQGSKPFEFPKICPECGSPLKKFGEKMLSRCPNMACPPQVRGRIEHFASRNCMDIRGLGEKVVSEIVGKLGVRDPADLYNLTRSDLMGIGKFKDKSADNLLRSIEESKSRELWRLIFGLGILEIGEQFAKELASKFKSLDALMAADIEKIKSIDGMGLKSQKRKAADGESPQPVRALSVRAFFDDAHNRDLIERLRKAGLNFFALKESGIKTPFTGKLFAITGTLSSMDRNKAKSLVEKFGGKMGASVTSKTDYLVSAGGRSSKTESAEKFGTEIIDESAFLQMLSEAEKATETENKPGAKNPDAAENVAESGIAGEDFSDAKAGDCAERLPLKGEPPVNGIFGAAGVLKKPKNCGENGVSDGQLSLF